MPLELGYICISFILIYVQKNIGIFVIVEFSIDEKDIKFEIKSR